MAIKSKLMVKRKYSEVYSIIAIADKIWWYYSRVAVKDLRNKRFVRLTINIGSITNSNFGKVVNLLIACISSNSVVNIR